MWPRLDGLGVRTPIKATQATSVTSHPRRHARRTPSSHHDHPTLTGPCVGALDDAVGLHGQVHERECAEEIRQHIPFWDDERIGDALSDRSVNPLLRSYLWSYPAGLDWFWHLTEPAVSGGYVFKFDWNVAEEPMIKCTGSSKTCWRYLEVVEPDPLQPQGPVKVG